VDVPAEKHEVVIYDNLEPQVHKGILEYLNNGAEFIKEDIRDRAKLKEAISDSYAPRNTRMIIPWGLL